MSNAILGIGKVNTRTGANADFGLIWNCWEEGGTNLLCTANAKLIAVHTCEDNASYRAGELISFHHDQTGRRMGQYTIINTFQHTKEGLMNLGATAGCTSVKFYTFK